MTAIHSEVRTTSSDILWCSLSTCRATPSSPEILSRISLPRLLPWWEARWPSCPELCNNISSHSSLSHWAAVELWMRGLTDKIQFHELLFYSSPDHSLGVCLRHAILPRLQYWCFWLWFPECHCQWWCVCCLSTSQCQWCDSPTSIGPAVHTDTQRHLPGKLNNIDLILYLCLNTCISAKRAE